MNLVELIISELKNYLDIDDIPVKILRNTLHEVKKYLNLGFTNVQDIVSKVVLSYTIPELFKLQTSLINSFKVGKLVFKKFLSFLVAECIEERINNIQLFIKPKVFSKYTPDLVINRNLILLTVLSRVGKIIKFKFSNLKKLWNHVYILVFDKHRDIVKLNKPPYYKIENQLFIENLIQALVKNIDNGFINEIEVNKKKQTIYEIWKEYRKNGYLVLPGNSEYDLYAIKYCVYGIRLVKREHSYEVLKVPLVK